VDAITKEGVVMTTIYLTSMVFITAMPHPEPKPTDFSFFEQWAEVEVEDINYYIVGPH
jgi:hypothetical protein